jgi:hypothetical protein
VITSLFILVATFSKVATVWSRRSRRSFSEMACPAALSDLLLVLGDAEIRLHQLARFCTRPHVLLVPQMPDRKASSCTI